MDRINRSKWTEDLLAAVKKVDRPSSFCVSGIAQAGLPGLEVEGLGAIGLPLLASQAESLKSYCEQAAYGKGTQTLVDRSVRRVWRLKPDRFVLANPGWADVVHQAVSNAQRELGLADQKLDAHLYDLLLYEKGDFFLPHRDGEKLDRMVATLVIVLPSTHTGGELIVRHEDQERVIDFAAASRFQTQYAAFYADCEHEVKPLGDGYRLCLVYNLTLAKSKKSISAPQHQPHVRKIAELLARWPETDGPQKLAITLEHQYTQDGLAWDALKGADRAKAQALADAARLVNGHAYLALLTFWESASVEDDGGYSSRDRYDEDDEEENESPGDYTIIEVIDSSLTAERWSGPNGVPVLFGALPIDEDEVLPEGSLKASNPEEDFGGYTGNEGATLERWYRQAAIILWTDRQHFNVICSGSAKQALPVLSQMISGLQTSPKDESVAAKKRCLLLASQIIEQWPPNGGVAGEWDRPKPVEVPDPLPLLNSLDSPQLIRDYVRELLPKDPAIAPGCELEKALSRHGWETFRTSLIHFIQQTSKQSVARNMRLVEHLCLAAVRDDEGKRRTPEALPVCRTLAGAAVTALARVDTEPTEGRWYSAWENVGQTTIMLLSLTRALLAVKEDELFSRVTSHIHTFPNRYPLQSVQMPAIIELGKWITVNGKVPSTPFLQWISNCEKELEALTAAAPQPPADLCREVNIKCKCADCAELKQFMASPDRREHNFKMAQHRRDHLESAIRDSKCDLDTRTNRTPRPQILICTKNMASHHRRVKVYQQNLKHLADLRSIRDVAL